MTTVNVRVRSVALRLTVLAGVFVVLTLLWQTQQPSIKPVEIQIQAVMQPPGQAENPIPGGQDQWTVEITLSKSTERPLYESDGDWFFQVTPFVEGVSIGVWDFKQGLTGGTSGSTVGGTDFAIGNDSRHIPMVVRALVSEGVSVDEKDISRIPAMGYAGEKFPVEIRYYLSRTEPASDGKGAFVVYSHYEKRWGRDLSWTKTFPIQMSR